MSDLPQDSAYEQKLAEEAAVWGEAASQQVETAPPDWRYQRVLRHNVLMHTADIDALLDRVKPGMTTLELGCHTGWLTLAMAQRGATAYGLDISPDAINIARGYYEGIRGEVSGTAHYEVADLNHLSLPEAAYDVVVVKGTLHHLIALEHIITEIEKALRPGGLFWVSDSIGGEHVRTVLVAGGLTFILPTETSYRDKVSALFRFGLRAPSRVKASIEAEGLSPFEGAGREGDWVRLVTEHFDIEREIRAPAVTGYVSAQLRVPEPMAIPLLKSLRAVDQAAVNLNLLKPTGLVIYAHKKSSAEEADSPDRYDSTKQAWEDIWAGASVEVELEAVRYERSLETMRRYMAYLNKDDLILEAGSGLSAVVITLRRLGYRVMGMDYAENALRISRDYDPSLPLFAGDVHALPCADDSLGAYLSFGVLEHFEHGMGPALIEAHRILQPGGVLVLTIPAPNIVNRLIAWRRRRAGVSVLNDEEFYESTYTRQRLVEEVSKAGFLPIVVEPTSHSYTLWGLGGPFRAAGYYQTSWLAEGLGGILRWLAPWAFNFTTLVVARKSR
ncbi:MAG: methyltransferase domain-containing protein [Anaerolineae bacterium]